MKSAIALLSKKTFWIKHIRQWHWVSSALCLVAMLLFAITGVTLNHASEIGSMPKVETRSAQLPENLLARVADTDDDAQNDEQLAPVLSWLEKTLSVSLKDRAAEWSDDEIYFSLPRPGGDAWLAVSRLDGTVQYEETSRGLIAWMNDLHKGRHTGVVWRIFLDIFSVATLLFCLTGLFLLMMHNKKRITIWKVLIAGLSLPVVLSLFFSHI